MFCYASLVFLIFLLLTFHKFLERNRHFMLKMGSDGHELVGPT